MSGVVPIELLRHITAIHNNGLASEITALSARNEQDGSCDLIDRCGTLGWHHADEPGLVRLTTRETIQHAGLDWPWRDRVERIE